MRKLTAFGLLFLLVTAPAGLISQATTVEPEVAVLASDDLSAQTIHHPEAGADQQTLQQLANLLGDPLSPENPVGDDLKNISKHGDLSSPSPRGSEPLPRDIARSVSGQVEDNLKGTPIDLSRGEDSPPPVIGYLETRDRIIAINAGPEASYTIRSKDGKLLADRVSLAGLLGKYPELYQLLQGAVARPNRVIDASLSYR